MLTFFGMIRQDIFIWFFFIAGILLGSCARVGSPTGGPRDSIPPRLVYSEPALYATNVESPDIELLFDEYIQLNDVTSELIVSPPVDEKPQVKLRNRSVLIDMNNDLKDSVTYTLNFGDAIVDNNEGNPISGFEFVFSTGPHIDSFSVAGKLVNSFTLEPYEEVVHVMLFDNLADSAPSTVLPAFIGKATKDGEFAINNVKSDTFRIFALKDANSNLKYDLPNEHVAFYDSSVLLSPALFDRSDTIVADSSFLEQFTGDTLQQLADTVQTVDTTELRKTYTFYTPLFMFEEETEQQYLVDDNREDKHRLRMVFNNPLDSIHFEPLNIDQENWYLPEFSAGRDTLDLWLADTNLVKMDSIVLQVEHYGLDTVQKKIWLTDTILFRYTEKGKSSRRSGRRQDDAAKENKPQLLTFNVRKGGTVDLNSMIRINSVYPVTSVDTDSIQLTWTVDSVINNADFEFITDSLPGRGFEIHTNWNENAMYELFIPPNTFKNIYHYPQDTIVLGFKTQSLDYYGKVSFSITNVPHNLIIQFFSGDKIVRQQMLDTDQTITFDYMPPKEYQVKIIYDRNGNGEWDTGDYSEQRQPEKVDFYPEKISVRSNWEIEYDWDVRK